MSRPRLLDVCCCAGGASVGYARAGFGVEGVDIDPQPRYPFRFHQADAATFIREHGHEYDAIAGSPVCQVHSDLASLAGPGHVDILPEVRAAMIASGKPYVIENVEGAPLLDPVTLCGSMFDLTAGAFLLRRHRLFESNFPIPQPVDACAGRLIGGVYGDGGGWTQRGGPGQRPTYRGGVKLAVGLGREAMGIDWTTRKELSQAIPPAYTEHVGRALLAHLTATATAAA